ncbi:hypothetical protein [Streptomyces sp. NPDC053048]
MTILPWLWPIDAFLAAAGLIACALRASGRAVLPALIAVSVVTIAALFTK